MKSQCTWRPERASNLESRPKAAAEANGRRLRPRALFLLVAAGGEVDDVLAQCGGIGGVEGGVASGPDAGMEHDVEGEAQGRDPERDDGVPLVRVRGEQ